MGNGRKRQRRPAAQNHEDERWSGATEIPLTTCGCKLADTTLPPKEKLESPVLQVCGLESATGTVFARIRDSVHEKDNEISDAPRNRWRIEDVVETILNEICPHDDAKEASRNPDEGDRSDNITKTKTESSTSLLELGAVWVLDPASSDRPQNKPVWKRLFRHGAAVPSYNKNNGSGNPTSDSLFWLDPSMTLRIHSRPSRYPMAKHFAMAMKQNNDDDSTIANGRSIAFEKTTNEAQEILFAVLHKPVGLPSHATVDNGVENLLHLYQSHRNLEYASLPQRLDTETSGLVLVATHPRLATYFSKLLQQKTAIATTQQSSHSKTTTTTTSIQKRYRCLVALPKDSWEETANAISETYVNTGTLVEHFVDAKSKAPKTFVSPQEFRAMQESSSTSKWQLCRLRIVSMSPIHNTIAALVAPQSSCLELEIELLTGRTHQIRGQLAALGCPIVGDPLYGCESWTDRCCSRNMALQCCALSFPMHQASLVLTKRQQRRRDHKPSKDQNEKDPPQQLEFCLDSAWWRRR